MKNLKSKIVMAFLCTSSIAFAQGVYVEVNAGYGMPFNGNKNLLGEYSSVTKFINGEFSSSGSNENVSLSLGKGFNFGATLGYLFNEHIGAELQYSFLLGSTTEGSTSIVSMDDFNGPIETEINTYNNSLSSNFSRVIPTLVLQSGFEKINPYAKIGVVLGFGSVTMEDEENEDGDVSMMVSKYNGGMAIGLNTRFGVLIQGSGSTSYFAELNFIGMNYSPSKGEVTEYTENGADMLSTLTTSEREVEFEKEVTWTDEFDENEPSQEVKFSLPFGSIGLNLGVRVNL